MERSTRLGNISGPMRKVILNLYNGREPFVHISGRSQFGGANGTIQALRKRGIWYGGDRLTQHGYRVAEAIIAQDQAAPKTQR